MNFYKNGTNGGCGFDFGLQINISKERMGLLWSHGFLTSTAKKKKKETE